MKITVSALATSLILLRSVYASPSPEIEVVAESMPPLNPSVLSARNSGNTTQAEFWGQVVFWRKGKEKCNHFTTTDPDFILIPKNGIGRGETVGCVDDMPDGAKDMTSAFAVDPGNFEITVWEKPGCQGQVCNLSAATQNGKAPTCCIINGGPWKSYQIY